MRRLIDKETLIDRKVTILDGKVQPVIVLDLSDYRVIDGVPWSMTISLSRPDGSGGCVMKFERVALNEAAEGPR